MSKAIRHITLLALLVLVACSEVVDLRIGQTGGQLIVFGRVSNSTQGNYVSVHFTGELGQPPIPVVDAEVTIHGTDGFSERLIPGDSGMYHFDRSEVTGRIGDQYELELLVKGKRYVTRAQRMPEQVGTDSISWRLAKVQSISTAGQLIEEDVVEVFAHTRIDPLPDEFFLRWDIEEAYTYLGTYLPPSHFPPGSPPPQCYVVNKLNEQEIYLHNGKTNRAGVLPMQQVLSRRVDKTFQAKHYFNLIKSTLSEATYNYWFELDQVSNRQGSIFDVPPAPIEGNIISEDGEEVLGYFEVVSLDTTRVFLTHNDVPLFFFDECFKRGDDFADLFSVPRGCVQCLLDQGLLEPHCLRCDVLEGSSYQRPSYF